MTNPIILDDGTKEWYLNGDRHRIDCPAIELSNGSKSWYLNGKQFTEANYRLLQFTNGIKLNYI